MGANQIRLYRVVPGLAGIRPLIDSFARGGEGTVTSFDDEMLPLLHRMIADSSDLEVIPFGSLVRRSLEAAGEECRPLATLDQRMIAIGQAAQSLNPDSTLYRAGRFQGIKKSLARSLGEIAEHGVVLPTDDSFLAELENLKEVSLGLLTKIGRDTHPRQLAACVESVPDWDGQTRRLLLFLGAEAPPIKLKWLRWYADTGAEVQVVAPRHATDGLLFGFARQIQDDLQADLLEPGGGNRLQNNLFASTDHGGPQIEAAIVAAPDPLSECEWAIRSCLAVDEPRSCAIYARNLEIYGPLLEATAERLGLPLQLSKRVRLLDNSFARITLQLIEAMAGPDVRSLEPIATSSYVALSGVLRAGLAAALKDARSRRSQQWPALAEWLKAKGGDFAWLSDSLDWRDAALASVASLGEWTVRLSDLLKDLPWFEKLSEKGDYDAERDERACAVMRSSLENEAAFDRVGSTPPLSFREFAARCRQVWSNADVSVPSRDGIPVVGSASALGGAGVVYVLGMLEGVFPRRRSEEPILSDAVRARLGLPTSREVAAAERDEFYRVCSSASDSIVFSYPVADEDRDNIPAFYLELVKGAIGVKTVGYSRIQIAPEAPNCLAPADLALRHALESPRTDPPANEITSIPAAIALHLAPGRPLSIDGLRDVLECPFRFQMRRRIALRPNSPAVHWYRIRRLPELAGLAKAPIEDVVRRLQDSLESELDALAPQIPDWELKLLRSGAQRLIQEWFHREQRARKIWPRDLGSVRLNVRFGDHDIRGGIGSKSLDGAIPAVSTLKNGARALHLYSARLSMSVPEKLSDADRLYLGLWFALGDLHGMTALEIESSDGQRLLVVLSREGLWLPSDNKSKLVVWDLLNTENEAVARRSFHDRTKELFRSATALIDRAEIQPAPGPHCEVCDFGELCRQSSAFADEDSPFGDDETLGVA